MTVHKLLKAKSMEGKNRTGAEQKQCLCAGQNDSGVALAFRRVVLVGSRRELHST